MNKKIWQYFGMCCMCITWLKQFEVQKVPIMVGSIMVVGVLTHYALLHSVGDLKAVQMNDQHGLTQKLMLYKFELS